MARPALVFDIETIADLSPDTRDAVAALAREREQAPEHYGALCPPLARVACVAWYDTAAQTLGALFDARLHDGPAPPALDVPGAPGPVSCAVRGCESEARLLEEFGRVVDAHVTQRRGQLVTFNGRGFDLPVLVHRSLKHGVKPGRALLAKAAGEYRYKPSLHIDLMDTATFIGASPRWPLAAYAVGYGWPSPKSEMSGAQVGPAIQEGRLLDVVRYCVGDVLATTHVYRQLAPLVPSE